MNINVYLKEFSAHGFFAFNHDEGTWHLVNHRVTNGVADDAEVQDALFEQLDRELELKANDRDMGYF